MDNLESPFTCEGCVHAIMDTDQVGCSLNLLERLDAEKFESYYILDRTCLVKNNTAYTLDISRTNDRKLATALKRTDISLDYSLF